MYCPSCRKEECDGECMDVLMPAPVGRPGRNAKAETKYIGNSSMAPRKDHKGKGITLRDKRKGK